MRTVILPDLIPAVAQQLVPMTVELPAGRPDLRAPRIKIVGFVYCGGDAQGGAYALGLVYPDAAVPSSIALSPTNCDGPLPDVAEQLAHAEGAPDWVEVIKAHVTWTPWQLRFAVADAASGSKGSKPAPSFKNLGEFKTIPTSNLQILPPPGQHYRFDVAIGFLKSTIVAAVFPAGSAENPDVYVTKDPLLKAEMADVPAHADVLADAQYAFINQMLKLYAPTYQIPVNFQGMPQAMVAKNVAVSGGDNIMRVTGRLDYGNIGYNGAVRCEGEDLKVSEVTLDPPGADCNGDDMMARLQCEGQQAVLGASAKALGAALTNYYQGQGFHYSTTDRPLQFKLGDAEFTAAFEALKSTSRGSTFSEAGRVAIRSLMNSNPGSAPAEP